MPHIKPKRITLNTSAIANKGMAKLISKAIKLKTKSKEGKHSSKVGKLKSKLKIRRNKSCYEISKRS